MLMVIHAAASAWVGEVAPNPASAFFISFVLHFLMDFIPHGDHEIVNNYRNKKAIKRIYTFIIADLLMTILFILSIELFDIGLQKKIMFWSIFGGLLPDIAVAIYKMTETPVLKKFHDLHFTIHNFLPEKKHKTIPFISGIALQIILFFVLLKVIF